MSPASEKPTSPAPSNRRLGGNRFLRIVGAVLGVVVGLAVCAGAGGWLVLRCSLPMLDGERRLAGLGSPVTVERDAQGVPTIHAKDVVDGIRALGFLHAQERFFQMDVLRRKSAGELAEVLGASLVSDDKEARVHRFRERAESVLAVLPPAQRANLDAYTAGVNAGLDALSSKPWEYHLLRVNPAPWRPEDSLLIGYTLWRDLQDEQGRFERTLLALREAWGEEGLQTLGLPGDSHDAPLDGSTFGMPALPPPLAPEGRPVAGIPADDGDAEPISGSNAFTVAGRHSKNGAALLASDMHLGLGMPNLWYRAVIRFTESREGAGRVVGVTLPGTPTFSCGSNGTVAWGFTNSYIDTVDVVPVQVRTTPELSYRTPDGWRTFDERSERIGVKGGKPEIFTSRWTIWGPLLAEPKDGRALAVRWNAHDVTALNSAMQGLVNARSVEEALEIGHQAGMGNQNLLLVDRTGRIAWTVVGKIPRRTPGFDGLSPGKWSSGESGWTGWLVPNEVPTLRDPPEGLLWSANQRHVGGGALALLGNNGYDQGYRAALIRDRLRALAARGPTVEPADLLAIQLESSAPHLQPWRDCLLRVLATASDPTLREMREQALAWAGRAEPESAGYRVLREFRTQATERVLAPYVSRAREIYKRFNAGKLHTEDLVLRLLRERPVDRLDPRYADWDALLLASAQAVAAQITRGGVTPAGFTWGEANRLEMRHPMSRYIPKVFSCWLDLEAVPLPGDSETPRKQSPRHGASQRLVVAPGDEEHGIFHMPGGQSGHPLSPYYKAGHEAWVKGEPTPLLPGPAEHRLRLLPRE